MSEIPFDQRDGSIWINGELLPWKESKVHVLSHGMHYASAIFEGERMYNGKIFKSREHAERLHKSGEIMGMKIPYSVDEIEKIKYDVCKANDLTDCYIRVIAWRGGEQMGVAARKTKVHMAVAAWAWGRYFDEEKYKNGITLRTSPWHRPAPDTAPTQSKASGLYMICTMSKHAAEDDGYDDALMLDYQGNVAEGTGANFFAVKNGTLITPPPDCFLNGITRQTVIKIAKDEGIPFEERKIKPAELADIDEVFLTGTAAEITAVGQIDEHKFTVGEVTNKIRNLYEKLVQP